MVKHMSTGWIESPYYGFGFGGLGCRFNLREAKSMLATNCSIHPLHRHGKCQTRLHVGNLAYFLQVSWLLGYETENVLNITSVPLNSELVIKTLTSYKPESSIEPLSFTSPKLSYLPRRGPSTHVAYTLTLKY